MKLRSVYAILMAVMLSGLVALTVTPASAAVEDTILGTDTPIVIEGNGDFSSVPGVNGTGTVGDPWVISGLDFDSSAPATAISISNTTDYFEVRDCNIDGMLGGSADSGWGLSNGNAIHLYNVQNGNFTNVNMTNSGQRGIFANASSDILIENCNISDNYGHGIALKNCNNITIDGCEIEANLNGIDSWNTMANSQNIDVMNSNIGNSTYYGVWFSYVVDSQIVDNAIYANGITAPVNATGVGIDFWACQNNVIEGNVIKDTTGYPMTGEGTGIWCDGSHFNTFGNNTVDGSTAYGISVTSSSYGNTIYGNDIMNSGWGNLNVYTGMTNDFCYNTIDTTPQNGVYFGNADGNRLMNNVITGSSWNGITIDNSNNLEIAHNDIIDNTQYGISMWEADGAIIYENSLIRNSYSGGVYGYAQTYDNSTGTNYWNDSSMYGNFYADYLIVHPGAGITGHYWDIPYVHDNGSNAAVSDVYPLAFYAPIIITSNADFPAYAASGDGSAGTPWIIEGYNIRAGHWTDVDISGTTEYFILRDSTASGTMDTNVNNGVLLNNVVNGVIDNVTADGNARSGIHIEDSSDITVNGCSVSNNWRSGVEVIMSTNIMINDTTAVNNVNGFRLNNVNDSTVSNCNASESGYYGIWLYGSETSYRNNLLNNQIWNNGWPGWQGVGIDVAYAMYTLIDGNFISGTAAGGNGIWLFGAGYSIVGNNTVQTSEAFGISIASSSYSSTVVYNTFTANMWANINVYTSYDTDIYHNTISSGVQDGIYLGMSTGANIVDNVIAGNGWNGVTIDNSNSVMMTDNDINNNSGSGVGLWEGSTNSIYNNTFTQNNYNSVGSTYLGKQGYDNATGTGNMWDDGMYGNHWADYTQWYPAATITGHYYDTPYVLENGTNPSNQDNFPLANPPSPAELVPLSAVYLLAALFVAIGSAMIVRVRRK